MRSLLALLLFGLGTSANATLIQYDIRGNFGTVEASLLLDTAGASVDFRDRSDGEGNVLSCFRGFSATLGGQILGVFVDGAPVFSDISGIPGSASVGGEFREPECIPGVQFLAGGLSIAADTYQLDFFFRAQYLIPTAAEVLAMADPLATVLLSGPPELGDVSLRTATDSISFMITEASVREVITTVPEPPMFLLLLLGLTGLLIGRKVYP